MPEVSLLFASVGIPVFLLPPYSPDYNPIEETFSYLKAYLRQHDTLLQCLNDPVIVIKEALTRIKTIHCQNWITHDFH